MNIKEKVLQDILWLRRNHKYFSFCGKTHFVNKKGENIIVYSPDGVTAIEAFYKYESEGKIIPTRQRCSLIKLHTTKASLDLHIKMFAEDRAKGVLPFICFKEEFIDKFHPPEWVITAVENQKSKYYDFEFQI